MRSLLLRLAAAAPGILCLLAALGSDLAAAVPALADLGQGLAYRRVQRLPADLPSDEERGAKPLVLDLRGAHSEPGSATALAAWFQFRTRAETPLFVLLNAETDKPLLRLLAERPWPGVVTLGPSALNPAPDVPVAVTLEEDAAACAELARGIPAEQALARRFEKERRDEAHLNRPYAQQTPQPGATRHAASSASGGTGPAATAATVAAGDAVPESDNDADTSNAPVKESVAGQPSDAVLARAVHLHRTLVALRRLPPGGN